MNDPLIGRQLGNYQLTSLLGVGGMARVYRATQGDIGRQAAVKVLSSDFAHVPDVVRRFRVEAQAVNKISHPNIVQIFDFGTLEDGRPYYLMELFEGESLADRIKRTGAMQPATAVGFIDAVLDALDAAHRAGIVHRDLKPDNVFLAVAAGRTIVKLLDFGIAKLANEGLDKTRTGAMMGTPAYMAPEQCEGRQDLVGPPTDLYAVGCMLYEMVAGVVPFDAQSLGGLIKQHMLMTPRPLADRIGNLPQGLSQIVARCLAKEPAERPRSAGALREELAALASGTHAAPTIVGPDAWNPSADDVPRTVVLPPQPPPPAPVTPSRSRVPMAIAAVAIVAAATIGVLVVARGSSSGTRSVPDAQVVDAALPDAARRADAAVDAAVDAQPPPDAAPPDAPLTLQERLETLKKLCTEGQFTPGECAERRQQILDEWSRTH